jgi:hypothetical protein
MSYIIFALTTLLFPSLSQLPIYQPYASQFIHHSYITADCSLLSPNTQYDYSFCTIIVTWSFLIFMPKSTSPLCAII